MISTSLKNVFRQKARLLQLAQQLLCVPFAPQATTDITGSKGAKKVTAIIHH